MVVISLAGLFLPIRIAAQASDTLTLLMTQMPDKEMIKPSISVLYVMVLCARTNAMVKI